MTRAAARVDNRPNMRGAIEQDLPAGTKLWLSAWSKQVAGADFISAEIAGNGGPRKRGELK